MENDEGPHYVDCVECGRTVSIYDPDVQHRDDGGYLCYWCAKYGEDNSPKEDLCTCGSTKKASR